MDIKSKEYIKHESLKTLHSYKRRKGKVGKQKGEKKDQEWFKHHFQIC